MYLYLCDMSWIKSIIDSDSVIYLDGVVAFIMKRIPNTNIMIAETPVTQALWMAIDGNNPCEGKTDFLFPVQNVSYPMAKSFIQHLNEVTGPYLQNYGDTTRLLLEKIHSTVSMEIKATSPISFSSPG